MQQTQRYPGREQARHISRHFRLSSKKRPRKGRKEPGPKTQASGEKHFFPPSRRREPGLPLTKKRKRRDRTQGTYRENRNWWRAHKKRKALSLL